MPSRQLSNVRVTHLGPELPVKSLHDFVRRAGHLVEGVWEIPMPILVALGLSSSQLCNIPTTSSACLSARKLMTV